MKILIGPDLMLTEDLLARYFEKNEAKDEVIVGFIGAINLRMMLIYCRLNLTDVHFIEAVDLRNVQLK